MVTKAKYLAAAFLGLSITASHVHAGEEKKTESTNPFEMVIFNVSSGLFQNPKMLRGAFVAKPTDQPKNRIIELGVEVPYYKDYAALGFQYSVISGNKIRSKTSTTGIILGNEYTISAKFRYPMHFKFGDVAFTNAYRVGLLRLDFYKSRTKNNQYFQYGVVAIPSIGIDYFPIRWLGLYWEYSWRIHKVLLNKHNLDDDGSYKTTRNDTYTYSTTSVAFGIKLTF